MLQVPIFTLTVRSFQRMKVSETLSPGSLIAAARFSQREQVPRFFANLFS